MISLAAHIIGCDLIGCRYVTYRSSMEFTDLSLTPSIADLEDESPMDVDSSVAPATDDLGDLLSGATPYPQADALPFSQSQDLTPFPPSQEEAEFPQSIQVTSYEPSGQVIYGQSEESTTPYAPTAELPYDQSDATAYGTSGDAVALSPELQSHLHVAEEDHEEAEVPGSTDTLFSDSQGSPDPVTGVDAEPTEDPQPAPADQVQDDVLEGQRQEEEEEEAGAAVHVSTLQVTSDWHWFQFLEADCAVVDPERAATGASGDPRGPDEAGHAADRAADQQQHRYPTPLRSRPLHHPVQVCPPPD